jgi:hypothetical protein
MATIKTAPQMTRVINSIFRWRGRFWNRFMGSGFVRASLGCPLWLPGRDLIRAIRPAVTWMAIEPGEIICPNVVHIWSNFLTGSKISHFSIKIQANLNGLQFGRN